MFFPKTDCWIGYEGKSAFYHALQTNTTLTDLGLHEFQSMLWLIHFWKSTSQKQTFHSNDLCLRQCGMNTICKGEGWGLLWNGGVPSVNACCLCNAKVLKFAIIAVGFCQWTHSKPAFNTITEERGEDCCTMTSGLDLILHSNLIKNPKKAKTTSPFWVQFIRMTFTDTRWKMNQREKNKFCMFKTVVKRW